MDEERKPWYKQWQVWVGIVAVVLLLVGMAVAAYLVLRKPGGADVALAGRVYEWATKQGMTPVAIQECANLNKLDDVGVAQLRDMAKDPYAVFNMCRNTAMQQLHNHGIYPEKPMGTIVAASAPVATPGKPVPSVPSVPPVPVPAGPSG